MKASLLAGDEPAVERLAGWTLELGGATAASPIGRYAAALALLALGRDAEARHVAEALRGRDDFPTDVADTPANRGAILSLVRNADLLFIEAAFAQADAQLARERAHLTTAAAGQIAREAGVRRVEPFHFSARYAGEEARVLEEVRAAFGGVRCRPT